MKYTDLREKLLDFCSPEPMSGCWLWKRALRQGYGAVRWKSGDFLAHRLMYELEKGAIPEGLEIDHKCRMRCCINPDHLEVVTSQVNVLRGVGPSAINAKKTSCSKGHAYDTENTYRHGHKRYCRECVRKHSREYQRRKRQ